jgi:alkylated DNA repair dioxygenase AlkB
MDRLLTTVNEKMGTAYNSMLINKYRDMNCALGPHKDDETCLEPDASISTLSLGAVRRMHVSLNGNKNHLVKTITLTPGSLFTVMPDFQQLYFHSIAAGKRTSSKEK